MTTRPQTESHLNADQLAAFAEGTLPAPERALCLQHLAECAHCREVAFLAGAALPEQEPAPVPSRRFSFAWWPVLSLGAATVAAVLLIVAFVHHGQQSAPSAPVQMADRSAAFPPPPAITEAQTNRPTPAAPAVHALPKPSPAKRAAPPQASARDSQQLSEAPVDSVAPMPAPVAGMPQQLAANRSTLKQSAPLTLNAPAPSRSQGQVIAGAAAKAAPSAVLRSYSQTYLRSPNNSAEVAGTVTDPAGAVIAHAKITLDQTSGTAHRETFSGSDGRFTIGSLPPGAYRLEISSPGFVSQVRDVEVGTSQLAQVDTKLALGAVSESVEVQAASPALNTESATLQSALPDKQPFQTSVTNGARTLALESTGKLFLSKKAGKRWKAVHGPWKKSAVTNLVLTADQSFQVTTAQGSWLSADGEHWHPAN